MKNKKILITGGTGSWGQELIKALIQEGAEEIRVLARNEFLQFELDKLFTSHQVKCLIGDIRDRESLKGAMQGVDIVYHLAALKHVTICEQQPLEAIKTNVLGTSNVVEEAIEAQVEKVIYVSTDKVAEPSSTYGFTKAIGEKIVLNANGNGKTQLSVLRSGNVLGTHGSVIPLFKKQLEEGKSLYLTNRQMTRFFVGIEDAIQRLIKVTDIAKGGEIFVMKMPAIKIAHIAEVMLEAYGETQEKLIEIGARPGEKLGEVLITQEEAQVLYKWDQDFAVILPQGKATYAMNELKKEDKLDRYKSQEALVDKQAVKTLLKESGYIA